MSTGLLQVLDLVTFINIDNLDAEKDNEWQLWRMKLEKKENCKTIKTDD